MTTNILTSANITTALLMSTDESLANDLEELFGRIGTDTATQGDRDACLLLCAAWVVRMSIRLGPAATVKRLIDEIVDAGTEIAVAASLDIRPT
jgi:hypothetical protein